MKRNLLPTTAALVGCLLAAPAPVVAQEELGAEPVSVDARTSAAALADAYAELAAGRDRLAEQRFLGLAIDAAPGDAGPILGAALAAAAAGDADRAVQRLKAALVRGPEALREVSVGPALGDRLRAARAALEEGMIGSDDPTGRLLASASLDFLLGEVETARLSLAMAVRRDGLQPPMRALDRLIQEARLAPPPPPPLPPIAEPSAAPEPAAPPPVAAVPASEPPRLLRPLTPEEEAQRPRVFLDYEKLNTRVSEMAGSLESFQSKLLRSLMTQPVGVPDATPPEDP